jgi:hypothetical protein
MADDAFLSAPARRAKQEEGGKAKAAPAFRQFFFEGTKQTAVFVVY